MKRPTQITLVVTLMLIGWVLTSCGGGGGGGGSLPTSVIFALTDNAGFPVVDATVFLVPANDIDTFEFDGLDVRDGAAENADEPLEDAVRQNGGGYPQGVSGPDGQATVNNVAAGSYFWFAKPAVSDTEHLPGGGGCRHARGATTFLGTTVNLRLTSSPLSQAASNFVGTSVCLACHPAYATEAQHAHRLGFTVPGQFGPLQDPVRYSGIADAWARFLPSATFGGGTAVYDSDYDPNRGFDKFKTSLTDPTSLGQTVFVRTWLWRDTADNKFKITLENIINPSDPRSPWTLDVALTDGGAIHKQRNLVRVPGLNGLYPLLQWQDQGNESRFDRTRKVYRDYHLDFFWDDVAQVFKDPPISKAWDGNCTGCHVTGFVRFQDPVTMEYRTDAVDDPVGVFDVDGNGTKDEVNLGCEVCHGAGGDHQIWAGNPANQGHEARYIVSLQYLSPARQMLVCGRCHDRVQGHGPVLNDEPLNPAGEMPPVGISRADYLAQYTTRKGPASGSFWGNELHSKSHHQQYADFIKSPMTHNNRILATCVDCHDSHGNGTFERQLIADPDDPNSPLCAICHAIDLFPHMLAQTGATHAGNQTTCTSCHMARTAKTGAGTFGILLGIPSGTSSDPAITYFQNDIHSHLFREIARKTLPQVSGVIPGLAMPVPYTRTCGTPCHDPSQLQFASVLTEPWGGDSAPGLDTSSKHDDDDYGSSQEKQYKGR